MDLARVILGPITTEKSERLKGSAKTHALHVAPQATKIDVRSALKRYFDVDVQSVRILWVRSKARIVGRNQRMEKRSAFKKALVTLTAKSKSLDLASFRAAS